MSTFRRRQEFASPLTSREQRLFFHLHRVDIGPIGGIDCCGDSAPEKLRQKNNRKSSDNFRWGLLEEIAQPDEQLATSEADGVIDTNKRVELDMNGLREPQDAQRLCGLSEDLLGLFNTERFSFLKQSELTHLSFRDERAFCASFKRLICSSVFSIAAFTSSLSSCSTSLISSTTFFSDRSSLASSCPIHCAF